MLGGFGQEGVCVEDDMGGDGEGGAVASTDLPLACTKSGLEWWEMEGVATNQGEAKHNKWESGEGVPHQFDSEGLGGGLLDGGGGDWSLRTALLVGRGEPR